MLLYSGTMPCEPIGGEIGKFRTPRFLLKLPSDEREDARLLVVIGDGLVCFLGEVEMDIPGDLIPGEGGKLS